MNQYLDIVLRSVAVYLFMILALRIFGKKELSQLNSVDVILILLISNSVQNAMVGPNTSLEGGLLAASALFALNFIFRRIMRRFKSLSYVVEGKPEILIHEGKLDFKMLSKLDISHDELHEALREHGIEHFTDVKLAMLEPDGNISIISGDVRLRQTHYRRKRIKKNNILA